MKKDEATNRLRDLRGALEWLKSKELLLETDVEVNGDLEITGLQKHLDGSIPILFENVKDYPHLRAVTNLFGNIAVMNEMFGWANNTERTKALAQALTHPIPPIEVSQEEAPVYEHIITDDIDVNKWVLAIRHTPLETVSTSRKARMWVTIE
jgi:4-hydroxy-3-polyprenylbenzoate decarboxylase